MQVPHDLAHVGDEAHVEHAVGLVDDEGVDAGEVEDVAAAEVEQAPGRGGDEVEVKV